jgi:hypothetical protein
VAERQRGPKTVGDMVRSLGLVLAAVVVLLLITLRPQGQAEHDVDYTAVLTQARVGSAFPLVAPAGLPSGWRANSVYFDPPAGGSGTPGVTSWHVGFITPDNLYAAFEQTDGLAIGSLQDVLGDPTQDGSTSTVAGEQWQRWSNGPGDRHALVRTAKGVTVVVDGSAGWPELEHLAGSLRAGT